MGLATIDGVPFRLDPTDVAWDFKVKANDWQTVGGKVVQIFGTELGDMVVEGSFGVGGWQEQARFLQRMKDLGDRQVEDAAIRNSKKNPMRFLYPPKQWDFLVYLTNFQDPSGQGSVELTNDNYAPRWRLTFFIIEDNTGLKTIAQDAFIARLASGLGWKIGKYNGPLTQAEVEKVLGGLSTEEYLSVKYGYSKSPEGWEEGA